VFEGDEFDITRVDFIDASKFHRGKKCALCLPPSPPPHPAQLIPLGRAIEKGLEMDAADKARLKEIAAAYQYEYDDEPDGMLCLLPPSLPPSGAGL
jgi:hypothetical protein